MYIIDLNDDFIRQGAHITIELLVFTHNALHRRGSKEVILPQAQHPPGNMVILRVQHFGYRLGDLFLL